MSKILQIMVPNQLVVADFRDGDELVTRPVLVWALQENRLGQSIVGYAYVKREKETFKGHERIECLGTPCEEVPGFFGYRVIHPSLEVWNQ